MRMDDKMIVRALKLSAEMASPYILRHFPISDLQAEDMAKMIHRAFVGKRTVPVGAGHAAYTNDYDPEPVAGVLPPREVLNELGEFVDPLFDKIQVKGELKLATQADLLKQAIVKTVKAKRDCGAAFEEFMAAIIAAWKADSGAGDDPLAQPGVLESIEKVVEKITSADD